MEKMTKAEKRVIIWPLFLLTPLFLFQCGTMIISYIKWVSFSNPITFIPLGLILFLGFVVYGSSR